MDGRKTQFIIRLAEYLVNNQAGKSIALELESDSAMVPWAHEWARVRASSPIKGYATVEEATTSLIDFLG